MVVSSLRSSTPATRTSGPGAFWSLPLDGLFAEVAASVNGLSADEAARRLARDGPNTIEVAHPHRGLRLLLAQFTSPIVLILVAATVLSMALGDAVDGLVILVIIAASGALGFWQEHSAGQAVDALMAQVRVEVEVRREGREISVPVEDVVVGDVLVLSAGDVAPADCRVIESHGLLIDEAALTGESYPVEKRPGVVGAETPLAGRANSLFMGTHVVSGTGQAIVVINLVLHRPLVESLLFSLALAVGLTPQLLPAIVSISLSTGARRMAAEKVIVKRLDAIEDFGAMTVLCTDKTGTITAGAVRLDSALDLVGRASAEVLRLARLNAGLQRGFPNPLDQAILADAAPLDATARLDEIPYDFQRKRLSVLVDGHGTPLLVTKGAFDQVLAVCTSADIDGQTVPLSEARAGLQQRFATLSGDGDRVLTSADIDRLDDAALSDRAADTVVFAEVEPLHKERIVRALRDHHQVVGFLGDGINDAAALHAADVGISVDTAVDVAKQSAAIVLLDKSLAVVADGVRLGRQTFANTLTCIRVITSANFGNVLSMAIAVGFLPFLPLLPRQILLLYFLSDIPGTTIAGDSVDLGQVQQPRAWNLRSIRTFMIVFGLISSVFDILTFLTLRLGFNASATLFRSGWFIDRHRVRRHARPAHQPFYRSRPGRALLSSSIAIAAVTIALPYSPLAGPLCLTAVPARIVAVLVGLTALYVIANEGAKRRYPPADAAAPPGVRHGL